MSRLRAELFEGRNSTVMELGDAFSVGGTERVRGRRVSSSSKLHRRLRE